jgi:hypothetical protein
MNKKLYAVGVLAGAAALMASTAMPASAAAGDTTTTFVLSGDGISVAVQANATLTAGKTGAASVSGSLGDVTVTDLRGGTTNWNTSATSTTFTSVNGTTTSTSTGVSYNGGSITTSGTSAVPPATAKSLTATPVVVVGPAEVSGNNTATWNPTLTVSLPATALTGTYTGTVNTSVA